MKSVFHWFFVALLFLLLLHSTVYGSTNLDATVDPCATPVVQNDIRPDPAGPPTEVAVGVFLIDLLGIDDIKQTLEGDFAVVLAWLDPRLSHLAGCQIALQDIWSPGLVIVNSGRKFASLPKVVRVGPGGRVEYRQRYSGVFATHHSLHNFPLDDQVFRISFTPFDLSGEGVTLVVEERLAGRRDRLNISDWTIKDVGGTIRHHYSTYHQADKPIYDFNIRAKWLPQYLSFWPYLSPSPQSTLSQEGKKGSLIAWTLCAVWHFPLPLA